MEVLVSMSTPAVSPVLQSASGERSLPKSDDRLTVVPVGTPTSPFYVYIYADVLDELRFNATSRAARGMLLGAFHPFFVFGPIAFDDKTSDGQGKITLQTDNPPPTVDKTQDTPANDIPAEKKLPTCNGYVEITAFRDVFSTSDALDYAGYLRRIRNFRTSDTDEVVLGAVAMGQGVSELSLEDLMLQRSYFARPYQVALFVDSDQEAPCLYWLDEDGNFVRTGYFVVTARDNPDSRETNP